MLGIGPVLDRVLGRMGFAVNEMSEHGQHVLAACILYSHTVCDEQSVGHYR